MEQGSKAGVIFLRQGQATWCTTGSGKPTGHVPWAFQRPVARHPPGNCTNERSHHSVEGPGDSTEGCRVMVHPTGGCGLRPCGRPAGRTSTEVGRRRDRLTAVVFDAGATGSLVTSSLFIGNLRRACKESKLNTPCATRRAGATDASTALRAVGMTDKVGWPRADRPVFFRSPQGFVSPQTLPETCGDFSTPQPAAQLTCGRVCPDRAACHAGRERIGSSKPTGCGPWVLRTDGACTETWAESLYRARRPLVH